MVGDVPVDRVGKLAIEFFSVILFCSGDGVRREGLGFEDTP